MKVYDLTLSLNKEESNMAAGDKLWKTLNFVINLLKIQNVHVLSVYLA